MSHQKTDASTAIEAEIKVQRDLWRKAHEQVTEAECRMEDLRELLSYAVCQKCGAEVMGGIQTAKGVMMEAKAAGRRDGTCPGCLDKAAAALILKCEGHLCGICRQIKPCDKINLSPSAHGRQDCRECLNLLSR